MASVQAAAATDGEPASSGGERPSDPSYMWVVESEKYLLRLRLPGLKLEDFRVRVDGKRRLTVTDRRKQPTTPGGKVAPRLNKTKFQLPKTANPDAVTGRFDGDVLTLTVPTKGGKQLPPAGTAAAAAKEEQEEPKAKAAERREKELIDTAVAAFTLGVFFSHRIFSGRNEQSHTRNH